MVAALGKGVLVLSMSTVVDNLTEEERKSVEDEVAEKMRKLAEDVSEETKKQKLSRRSSGVNFVKRMTSKASSSRSLPLQRSASTGSILKSTKEEQSLPITKEELENPPAEPGSLCPGKSVLYNVETTTVPIWLEHVGVTISGALGFKNMFKTYSKNTSDQVSFTMLCDNAYRG